jgi:hypothetical protein
VLAKTLNCRCLRYHWVLTSETQLPATKLLAPFIAVHPKRVCSSASCIEERRTTKIIGQMIGRRGTKYLASLMNVHIVVVSRWFVGKPIFHWARFGVDWMNYSVLRTPHAHVGNSPWQASYAERLSEDPTFYRLSSLGTQVINWPKPSLNLTQPQPQPICGHGFCDYWSGFVHPTGIRRDFFTLVS